MQMQLVQTHMVYGTVLVILHGKVKELDSKAMELIVMVGISYRLEDYTDSKAQ